MVRSSRGNIGNFFGAKQSRVLLDQEAVMRSLSSAKRSLAMVALAGGLLIPAWPAYGQDADKPAAQPAPKKMDLDTVGKLLEQLQGQVQELLVQVKELKTQQQAERSESAELRKELSAAKSQLSAGGAIANVESAKQNAVEPGSSSSE